MNVPASMVEMSMKISIPNGISFVSALNKTALQMTPSGIAEMAMFAWETPKQDRTVELVLLNLKNHLNPVSHEALIDFLSQSGLCPATMVELVAFATTNWAREWVIIAPGSQFFLEQNSSIVFHPAIMTPSQVQRPVLTKRILGPQYFTNYRFLAFSL